MRIQYGSIWLAWRGVMGGGPLGVQLDGEQLVDEVDFFRALTRAFYPRASRSVEFSFAVQRTFDSLREAQAFALGHFGDLPNAAALHVTCGEGADLSGALLADAVLRGVSVEELSGEVVRVRYTFAGSAWATDTPTSEPWPDEDPEEPTEADVTRRGTVAIADGATSVVVTFTALDGAPVVVLATVHTPAAGDQIFATVDKATISATGFTAYLSGPTPGTGYELHYLALR